MHPCALDETSLSYGMVNDASEYFSGISLTKAILRKYLQGDADQKLTKNSPSNIFFQ